LLTAHPSRLCAQIRTGDDAFALDVLVNFGFAVVASEFEI